MDDSLSLITQLRDDLRSDYKHQGLIDAIGATVITISLVSDILRNTVGEITSGQNALMKFGLENVYDKARDKKWSGNRYETTINSIKETLAILRRY
ncbi:MAG: hypothetical protein IPG64_23460 [Haliea sp.]|nr:hypothetical protein [Haliea sp.]